MNRTRRAIHRIRSLSSTGRRLVLHLVAVGVVLLALIPGGQPAHADTSTTCILTASGPLCPNYPPPDLLNLNQQLYAATDAQRQSLQTLETQAISNTIADHDLAGTDGDAVKSWGRADAEAELFALLVQAVKATSRTTDQQNAVDWLQAVEQRQAVVAAQDAGREYARWAGLDQGSYQSLLSTNASQSALQAFLSANPEPFNGTGFGTSTGGFCVYRPPTPYTTEYNDSHDPLCSTSGGLGCLFTCSPPTPSYDQFVKWGEADATYASLSSSASVQAASLIATGLIFGGTVVGAGVGGAALSTGLASALVGSALQEAILPYANIVDYSFIQAMGEEAATAVTEATAATEIAASAGAIVGALIFAITTAVIEGINVANAAALPGKLAALIVNAETSAPDPATLLTDTNGASSLFSLFVGATLPLPANQTCDNATMQPGLTVISGIITATAGTGCLNPTAIPPASGTDPTFLVQAKDATTQTTASTITWVDQASQATLTARLSGNWFIDQADGSTAAAQTLSIPYTDWTGNEQVAWLVGNATAGYRFVGYNVTAGASTPLNPAKCLADGVCWSSDVIDYVGRDGVDYAASVRGYTPPTGSPSSSTPVEGSPVTFSANDYAPGSATTPITYTWEFEQTGCGMGFGAGSGSVTVLCPNWDALAQLGSALTPDYTAPVTGATATHTYPTSGHYLVRLTATDATGKQAVDTFTVAVGDAPPTLALTPACPLATPCDTRTGGVGTALTLDGTITHAGSQDSALVLVNWGDGSSEDIGSVGSLRIFLPGGSPVTLTPDAAHTRFTLSDAHTYATGGTYHVTVSVIDQGGGTASQTVVETITNPAPTTHGLDLTSAPPVSCLLGTLPGPSIIPPAPAVAAIGSSPVVTVTGSGFVPDSTVQWNGTPLATTYVSPCQLTAQVPATDTASATVGALTVVNAAPGGGTSNPQVLYITPQGTLAAGVLAPSSSGSAAATVGGHSTLIGGVGLPGTPGTLSATASGAGALGLAQYSTDPLGTAPPAAVNAYFDVFTPASSFSSVQILDCNLSDDSAVSYYDSTAAQWTPVSGQSYDAGTGCVSFTLNAFSTPSLSQLSSTGGAVFGVGNAPPTVADPGPQSVPYGSQVSIPVSATDPEATDQLTLHASGLPAGLSLHDNGDGTGTLAGTVTADVGPYTATVSANDGYGDATPVTVAFTVTPAPLTITATNKSMTYGSSVPAFDASESGLRNGDSSSVVNGLTCGAVDGRNNPVSGSTPVGQYSITCSGGRAANYALSYQPGTLTISKATTSVTVAAAAASTVFGQSVTVTARIAVQSPGAGHPGGTVEFTDGSTDIGGCAAQPVDTTTGTATCTTSGLSVATHSISATYSGDPNVTGSSTAAAVTQTVSKDAVSATLGSSLNPITSGQAVTFTAMVAAAPPGAGTPTGSVTFKDGATTLGTGSLSTSAGVTTATFKASGLGVGTHPITATYGGDGHFLASTGNTLTQYVNTNLSSYPTLASGAYNLAKANLSGGYFVGVNLAGASLSGSNLTGAVFLGANLTGANLSNSNVMGGATFTNATLQNANLSNSNLKGATFRGVNLSGANLSNSNLMGATGLKTATLTTVVWSKTTCPDGTLSNNDGGSCVGHL